MRVGILGVNHKSAEIYTRELISKTCHKWFFSEGKLAERYHCVILSTCNRTEIYFSANDLAEAHSELLNVLREDIHIPFEHKLYSYFGFDCFLHLANVTAGLDSLIIAETEIQRQVKISYEQTLLYYPLPSCMHYLFQKSLKLGKYIRTHFPLVQNRVTIEKILFEFCEYFFKDFKTTPVLFVGNSEVNRKVMTFFKQKGVQQMSLCTRSWHSAKEMAQKEGIRLLPWENLSQWKEFSLVICGSNAPSYLIHSSTGGMCTQLIFDLGVPRNVDPCLSRHPCLTVLNMEELGVFIEHRQKKNLLEMDRAKSVIWEGIQRDLESFRRKENMRVPLCV